MNNNQRIMSRRLRELVAEGGKSYFETAMAAGVSKDVLLRAANGQGMPNSRQLIPICLYFGVSADYLLGLKEERT